jgi:glutamine synthetase
VKPKAVLAYCRERGIKSVDLRFSDIQGNWRRITLPLSALTEASFEEGFGQMISLPSSPRDSQVVAKEYANLVPQSDANYLDPFTTHPTLILLASIQDAMMREESAWDSRQVAIKATRFLETSTIGDGLMVSASVPFCMLGSPPDDSNSANTFLACGLDDKHFTLRCDIADIANEAGLQIDRHFCDINNSSSMILKPSKLVESCDDVMMLRYLVSQLTSQRNVRVCFDNLWIASHWTISRQGESIFTGGAYRGMSDIGLQAMSGILHHASSICAIAVASSPRLSTFPWLRLCSSDHPDSICRIAIPSNQPRGRLIEFFGSPAQSNPYLVNSAVVMAMIDGIQNKMAAGKSLDILNSPAFDRKHYTLGGSASNAPDRTELKSSLDEDRDFLIQGEVFSDDLIDSICDLL